MNALRIGSLCTGYAGLDAAVQAVFGGELAWVADPDPGAAAILAHHHPDVPNLRDITALDWSDVAPVDILCGGYPCQPFSDAGKRKGVEDERHIWPYFATAIRVLRPRVVVLENVRGHLGRGFDTVLGDLASLGFDAEWRTLRASDVGAPHRRERLFVIATASIAGCLESERWGSAGLLGSATAAEPREGDQRQRTGDAALGGGASAADAADHGHERGRLARGRRPGSADGRLAAAHTERIAGVQPDGHAAERGRPGQAEQAGLGGRAAADSDRNEQAWQPREQPRRVAPAGSCRITPTDTAGERHGHAGSTSIGRVPAAVVPGAPVEWRDYAPAIRRWEHVTGRSAPRPTEPGRTGERLSPAFVEWLMGLPAGHVTDVPGLSRNAQLKALGNGVVPQQAIAALTLLMERRAAA